MQPSTSANPLFQLIGEISGNLKSHERARMPTETPELVQWVVGRACSDIGRYGGKLAQAISLYAERSYERFFKYPGEDAYISLDKDGHLIKINNPKVALAQGTDEVSTAIGACSSYEVLSGPRCGTVITGNTCASDIPIMPTYRRGLISGWAMAQQTQGAGIDLSTSSFGARVTSVPDVVLTLDANSFGERMFVLFLGPDSRNRFLKLAPGEKVLISNLMREDAPVDMKNMADWDQLRADQGAGSQATADQSADKLKLCSVITTLRNAPDVEPLQLGRRTLTFRGLSCFGVSPEKLILKAATCGGISESDLRDGIRAASNGKTEGDLGRSLVQSPNTDGVIFVYDEDRLESADTRGPYDKKPKAGLTLRDALLGCIVIGGDPEKLQSMALGEPSTLI